MEIQSGYLVGCFILGIAYLIIGLLRKDLWKEMHTGGIILVPFAIVSAFYIPEYWNPPYFYGIFYQNGFGVEDIFFMYFVGGICASIYELVTNRREVKISRKSKTITFFPLMLFMALLLIGEYFFKDHSIIILCAANIVVGLYMIYSRHDLIKQSLSAGLLFAILYYVLFVFFNALYPSYIELVYTHTNLLGIYISGIPIEEFVFAFSMGFCWSIGYEYMLGYKTMKIRVKTSK